MIYCLRTNNMKLYVTTTLAVYYVNGKVNLHINLKNLILMNIRLVILISNCLLLFQWIWEKISSINLKRNPLAKRNNSHFILYSLIQLDRLALYTEIFSDLPIDFKPTQ